MPTFALIGEGLTDQVVLEQLLDRVCDGKFEDEIDINPIQPVRDATDMHTAPHAVWGLVLEACELKGELALDANDFLVVQIDTDCGDEIGFGVCLTDQGRDRSVEHIIADTKEVLISRLGRELYDRNSGRIIFAVCVHSIESWLLLILFADKSTKNSYNRLNRALVKANDDPLVKTFGRYKALAKRIGKRDLAKVDRRIGSLGDFLEQVDQIA